MKGLSSFGVLLMSITVAGSAAADQVVIDDLIVEGLVCIGVPCVDGEVFDLDTLRLKGSDPRIRLQDTSASASFPTNDWSMGVKSEVMTDIPYFYLMDEDGGRVVLKVTAGSNSGVALGANADVVDGAISVGSQGGERRIVNVATGTDDHDAVTKAQLDAAAVTLGDRIDALTARIDAL